MNKKGIITLILLGILTFMGCGEATEKSQTDESRSYGSDIANYWNLTSASEYNNEIYYSVFGTTGLFKSGINGDTPIKLNSDNAINVNIYKDKIYYINAYDTNKTELIKVNLDGETDKEVISENAYSMRIIDDKLIYMESIDGLVATEDTTKEPKNDYKVIDLKNNIEITSTIKDGQTLIIDENTFFSQYSTSNTPKILDNSGNVICELKDVNQIIALTEEYFVVNKDNNETDSNVYIIDRSGATTEIPNLTKTEYSVLIGDDYYYFNNDDFQRYNITTNKVENICKIEKVNNKQSEDDIYVNQGLFNFDGIIYAPFEGSLIPIYNTKTNEIEEGI